MKNYTASEAVDAIEKLIRDTHSVKWNGVPTNGLKYKGPELSHCSLTATCLKIKESLSEENFEHSRENGVSPLGHLLMKCYQLGFNRCAENNQKIESSVDRLIESMKNTRKD